MENYKFDKNGLNQRKQFFYSNDDDYFYYRNHIFKLANEIVDLLLQNKQVRILEIGPSTNLYKENAFPDLDTKIISNFCKDNNIYYKTLDINEKSSCDFIGSIEDLSFIKESFDIIVLLSVLEHTKNIFNVSKEIFSILNKNGYVFLNTPYMFKVHGPIPDYWRFSEYGFKALFEDLFFIEKIESFPKEERGKNSFPLTFNVVLRKF